MGFRSEEKQRDSRFPEGRLRETQYDGRLMVPHRSIEKGARESLGFSVYISHCGLK